MANKEEHKIDPHDLTIEEYMVATQMISAVDNMHLPFADSGQIKPEVKRKRNINEFIDVVSSFIAERCTAHTLDDAVTVLEEAQRKRHIQQWGNDDLLNMEKKG
ncbi:MAG: hypothetical protein A2283_03745 [Lentisphaerae bacterium RIFOXYA12_FULL_48_11]|nr:MAG: hypothetical protein A2283_03745 [Lentisphaerae bacterium RIFOXYA12_FULL_48_11]